MNKKTLWMLAVILCYGLTLQAQPKGESYFTKDEMPDMVKFLPAPPDSTSVDFARDLHRYFWGKEMRNNPERAAMALRDAVFSLETILTEYEEAFGMKITKEGTPEIYKLLLDGTETAHNIGSNPKRYYMRRRPFMRFNEPTLYPQDDDELRHNGSYPSGHTILGWSAALLMMEINPDRANEIMARGYQYGESRVIVGAHWQSDVDAGRLVASVAYAKMHTSDAFLKQMAKARKEFQRLSAKSRR